MTEQGHQDIQTAVDSVLATGAITTPMWLQFLEDGVHIYVLVGGAILLTLRIVKTVFDILKARKKAKKEEKDDPSRTDNDAGKQPTERSDDPVGKEDGGRQTKD